MIDRMQQLTIVIGMVSMMETKIIEYFGGPADGRRHSVDIRNMSRPFLIPMRPAEMAAYDDGMDVNHIRVATYQADGSYTSDGAAIVRIRSLN